MNPSLVILTGASRGLGLAMAQQLAGRSNVILLTIARSSMPRLSETHAHWAHDLADPAPVAQHLQAWLSDAASAGPGSIAMIHNAALLAEPSALGLPPSQAGNTPQSERWTSLQAALRVGLEAPLVLSDAFLASTHAWHAKRKLLFISSGLGRFAMAGNASYCAIKAGMDHLARALALEQVVGPYCPNPAAVVSLAPGVIDTDMQVQLRSADPARFVNQERFAVMKEQGQLDSPETAASKVLSFLDREDFGSKTIADVRDAQAA
jgi:benzil reductase ((S)-benzoin forming)